MKPRGLLEGSGDPELGRSSWLSSELKVEGRPGRLTFGTGLLG